MPPHLDLTFASSKSNFVHISAVRLGRCPKKDKPSRFNFFKLPEGAIGTDVEKQIRTEQMILCIHEAFRAARKEFDIFTNKYNVASVSTIFGHSLFKHEPNKYGSWIYNNLCNQCLSQLKL